MDGKFCVECGARISIDASFCRVCGRRQPEITIPPELMAAPKPAPVMAEEKASAAAETVADTAETKAETAEEKAAEPEKTADFEPETEAVKPPEQPAPAPEPKPVPDLQSYLNNGGPQLQSVNEIPEPKHRDGIHPAYILLIGSVLFIVALLVWAIFATNKFTMTHQTKHKPSSSVSVVKPTEPPETSSKSVDKDKSSSSNSRSEYSGVNGKSAEYIESGDYKVGEGIDAGEYIFVSEDKYSLAEEDDSPHYESFYAGVSSSASEDDDVCFGWFQCSTYMKLEEGQYLHFSWAKAYPVDSYHGENDPFEHPGLFLVGRDVKPGTYSFDVLTDQGYESYAVFDSIDEVMADDGFDGHNYGIEKGEKVELEKGQYIRLEWCKLKRQ